MTTIRGRLLVMLLAGLTVVLTAGGAGVYWIERSSLLDQFDAGLKARAQTLASLVKFEPEELIFESGDAPTAVMNETYFEIRTQDGRLLKRSANLSSADAALPMRGVSLDDLVFEDTDLPNETKGRVAILAFRPRVDPDDWEGIDISTADPEVLIVAAALDRRTVDQALATLLGALIVVGCVVGATIGVLVTVGVRWGLSPLDRLSRQLGGVSGEAISRHIDDAGAPRELEPVYRELNAMLDRVEQTLVRERSFVDAAAHELRTPLSELRTTAEVAIRWPDSDRAVASLHELLAIGREMERLVEFLLLISRGDAAALESEADEVPVASVVHACLERVNGSIDEKNLNLTIDLDEAETVRAPRDAVEIIVRNLIDNAVRYTPPRGSIAIRDGKTNNGSPTLVVENGPVQLAATDLPRLFEPFWQMERSRSDRLHAGLGLAVVHQIALASGLRVEAGLKGDRLQMRLSSRV